MVGMSYETALPNPSATLAGLTIQQLRCFVAAADTQHFTAAARTLGVAQPSLSAQITKLEAVLGVQLFHRDHRPVRLTDEGTVLLPLARRVVVGALDVMHGVEDLDSLTKGTARLGATPSLAAGVVPRVLAGLRATHPQISIEVLERGSDDLGDALESGEVELALTVGPEIRAGLDWTELTHEELVVVVNPQHPLATRSATSLGELAAYPVVLLHGGYDLRRTIIDAYTQHGLTLRVGLDGAEISSVLGYVRAGLGAGIVPATLIDGAADLTTLTLHDPHIVRHIGIARVAGHDYSRAGAALVAAITSYIEGHTN